MDGRKEIKNSSPSVLGTSKTGLLSKCFATENKNVVRDLWPHLVEKWFMQPSRKLRLAEIFSFCLLKAKTIKYLYNPQMSNLITNGSLD
jgi:hypothetical protein